MVILSVYNDSAAAARGRRVTEKFSLDSLEAAIRTGQESGRYYEVHDLKTGRTIDWNEVNVQADDDWYYDDAELIWKRRRDDEPADEPDFVISRFQFFSQWPSRIIFSGT